MNILLRTIALPLFVLAGSTVFVGGAFAMDAMTDCAMPHDAMSADAMKPADAMASSDAMAPTDAMKPADAMVSSDAMAPADAMKPADATASSDAMTTAAMGAHDDAMKTDCPK